MADISSHFHSFLFNNKSSACNSLKRNKTNKQTKQNKNKIVNSYVILIIYWKWNYKITLKLCNAYYFLQFYILTFM